MIKPLVNTIPSYSELAKSKGGKTLEKIGQDFESFFITSMLKELDKTTHISKKKSYEEETYRAIMYEKLGDYLAKKGLGIKDMLLKYMERAEDTKVSQENGDNTVK